MTRFVIDAATLLHIVAEDIRVGSGHQLVAPNLVRSEALTLLLEAVRRGDLSEDEALRRHERLTEFDPVMAARAEGVEPVAAMEALLSDPE